MILKFILIINFLINLLQIKGQFAERTRSYDIWNPLGTTTTRRPGQRLKSDEIIVRLVIGDIIGRRHLLEDLPWTPNKDELDVVPVDRLYPDPDRLPLKNNITIFSFLGVPYAEPPTANRRFKPPQILTQLPTTDPYTAFEFGPSCAQDIQKKPNLWVRMPYPYKVSEDCLYLNIYTPDASKSSGQSYPVLVFFHGGNNQWGSSSDWPGHILASRGMVVVTVNYRLGPFGYMSLGDMETGNYGLQDQRCALQWIQHHISAFGGDVKAVTIAGHDAAGVNVGLHMLSYQSKSLFRQAISLSGGVTSYHTTIGKPELAFNNTMKLGRYLGCTQAIAYQVWDCIMTRSTSDIIQATATIPIEYTRYLFMPSVDGKEILAHPRWILESAPSGGFNIPSPVPLLIGLNQQDGVEYILEDRKLGEFSDFLEIDQEYLKSFAIEYAFRHNYTMNREAIAEAIISEYTYWPDKSDSWMIRQKIIELLTDTFYVSPITQTAHLFSQAGSRVFMYVNNHNFSKSQMNMTDKYFPPWMGVCHECDLYLMFGFPFLPKELRPLDFQNYTFTSKDRNASFIFSKNIKQFVTKTDPNLPTEFQWIPYEPRAHWYMDCNYTLLQNNRTSGILKRDYKYEVAAFWNNYLPALVNYMTTTFPPEEISVRRQLIAFQITTAVLVIILVLILLIALQFAYCLFSRKAIEKQERKTLVSYQECYPSTPHMETYKLNDM
uniref:COesterase domain-containing protein n=1 Tax=Parastrongyloides trichosuri TaxID=131310 RepID=A0A0N4Z6L7_PARTI